MVLAIALLAIWLLLLWFAANYLVNSSIRIAKYFNLSALFIWLTIVAMGTSMPELFLSASAALSWNGALSVGNVIWSNIFNLWFILWLSAIICPMVISKKLVRRDWLFLVLITMIVFLMMWNQHVARWEWAILLALLVTYNAYLWIKKDVPSAEEEEEVIDKPKTKNFTYLFGCIVALSVLKIETLNWTLKLWFGISNISIIFIWILVLLFVVSMIRKKLWKKSELEMWMFLNIAKLVASLWLLVLASDVVVNSAIFVANYFWVSERAIWATIVAAWTSLPEIAATVAAVIKKKYDMWIWNVIGSDIFNILWIIWISSVIAPLNLTSNCLIASWCDGNFLSMLFRDNIFSLLILIATLIITLIFMRTWWKLSRKEWAILFLFALARMAFEIKPEFFIGLLGL